MPKCSVCGINDVAFDGGVCEMCAVSDDPYIRIMQRQHGPRSGGPLIHPQIEKDDPPRANRSRQILVGHNEANNLIISESVETSQDAIPVYKLGHTTVTQPVGTTGIAPAPASPAPVKNAWVCEGIIKNVQIGVRQRNMAEQLFDALFNSTPMTKVPDVLSFQVYPDYGGTNLTSAGTVCDQVLVYGQVNVGSISENNHVRVYGNRDRQNNIVATKIENTASGTVIQPGKIISPIFICLLILVFGALLFFLVMSAETIVPAIGTLLIIVVGILTLPKILKFLFGWFRH